ncbi:MAG: hypothetical protein M3Q71_14035 [Chloroflexota bacterium]|nr:hypothetical protein [Chloroflexota bacterium]
MAMGWRQRIRELGDNRVPLAGTGELDRPSLDNVRTLVHRCDLVDAGTDHARLLWLPGDGVISPPLHESLKAFVALSTAQDVEVEVRIHGFARRFGPLGGGMMRRDQHGDRAELSEPVAAWRRLSEGYAALLALASDVRHDRPLRSADWPRAMATLAIPAWLSAREGVEEPPGMNDLAALALVHLGVIEDLATQEAERAALIRLIGRVVRLAGLSADAHLDAEGKVRPAFALPVRGLVRGNEQGISGYWRVPGLLPVLAYQLAEAIDDDWTFRCSRCGEGATARERRPRGTLEWYGDHDHCRDEARKETRRASRAKARKARTEVKVDSHRDSQAGG